MAVTYATWHAFAGVATGCRRDLAARGWHECESFKTSEAEFPHLVDFTVVKGASVVFVSVAKGRGELAGRTIVSYKAQPILTVELLIADDAFEVKLNALAGQLEYRSNRAKPALAAFYRDAYRAAGFSDATPKGADDGVLIFSDGSGSRLAVQLIEPATGGRRVTGGPAPREQVAAASFEPPRQALSKEGHRSPVPSTKASAGACGAAMLAASSRIASPSAAGWFGLAG
jgi:hypothetical protein